MIIKTAKEKGRETEKRRTVDRGLEVGFYKENKPVFFTALHLKREFNASLTRTCKCMGLL